MSIHSTYDQALTIVSRLREAGFIGLFVGGWVRDYLLGREGQDIDIVTNASPEQVLLLFPKAIPVGVQFGVVRVLLDHHEFEVASFRSDTQYVDGRHPSQVDLHSSPAEDAQRRDFTINGLFFDPIAKTVIDYVGGKEDLEHGIIRAIGDPILRFTEDRLRIIRAIRFKNTFHFSIESATWQALSQESKHVKNFVSSERIWQELQKMLDKKILAECLYDMAQCGLLAYIVPRCFTLSAPILQPVLDAVRRYQGSCLAAVIGLFFVAAFRASGLQSPADYGCSFITDEFSLSRREAKIVSFFSRYGGFFVDLSDVAYVQEAAKEGFEEYLQAIACLQANVELFLAQQKRRIEELSFWIEQVKNNSFLIGGEDIKNLGVPAGKRMGDLLKAVFSYSITKRVTSKKALTDWIRGQI